MEWEALEQWGHHREGMPMPTPIPTTDGRHFVDGLVVMTYVEGGTARDRSRLASRRRHTPPPADDAGNRA